MDAKSVRERLIDIASFGALGGAALSLSILFCEMLAALNSSRAPDPSRGLIVPYDNNGVVHYISETQFLWLNSAMIAFLLCVALFFIAVICGDSRTSVRKILIYVSRG